MSKSETKAAVTEQKAAEHPAFNTNLVPAGKYAIEVKSPAAVKAAIQENLEGMKIGLFDMVRIKVPAGGGTHWELKNKDGAEEVKPGVEGVILARKLIRGYWSTPMDSGKIGPPDCKSDDGEMGVGNPGGKCKDCKFAQFGSDAKGRGQACKLKMVILLQKPDTVFPDALFVPPTSLKAMKDYFLFLASQGLGASSVVTSFTLVKDKNPDGVIYSRVVPQKISEFDEARASNFRELGIGIRSLFETSQPKPADVAS